MTWPVAAVVIALILACAGVMKALVYAVVQARTDEVQDELDQVWNAIEITTRDVERLTPIHMSLEDQ